MVADDSFMEDMIPYVEFADNANERTPCVLVLDCSGSMRGEPIKQLNAGLKALEKELKEDIDASSRVQLLIIKAFGKDEAVVSSDWTDAMNFEAPTMEAGGLTPLGKAMELALKKIEEQKCLYDSCGITSKRPWIFLISDVQNAARTPYEGPSVTAHTTFTRCCMGKHFDAPTGMAKAERATPTAVSIAAATSFFILSFIIYTSLK